MAQVILISVEGYKFKVDTNEKSREASINKAFDKLIESGLDSFEYMFYSINY